MARRFLLLLALAACATAAQSEVHGTINGVPLKITSSVSMEYDSGVVEVVLYEGDGGCEMFHTSVRQSGEPMLLLWFVQTDGGTNLVTPRSGRYDVPPGAKMPMVAGQWLGGSWFGPGKRVEPDVGSSTLDRSSVGARGDFVLDFPGGDHVSGHFNARTCPPEECWPGCL
jgi:hypothetical protein